MARQGDPRDLRLVVSILRVLTGWSQTKLAEKSGVDKGLISDYELAAKSPTRKTLERLAAAAGTPYSFIEHLTAVSRSLRLTFEEVTRQGPAEAPADAGTAPGLEAKLAGAALEAMAPFLQQLRRLDEDPEAS